MVTPSRLLRFTGALERDPVVERWLEAKPGDLGSIARRWFERMRACGPSVRELVHDGHATACVDDTPFAYVGVFRAHVNVGFFQGVDLPDPGGLLEGDGKRMRHVKVVPGRTLDEGALDALIGAAYRDTVMRLRTSH